MIKRITFNTDDNLTIDSIDRYAESNGTSRSKVICELLRSTAPILDFVTYQNRITQEVESRLFSLFYHEVRHFETQNTKDEITLKHLHLLSKKLIFSISPKPVMEFSLPPRQEWEGYRKEFCQKVSGHIELFEPESKGDVRHVYLCVENNLGRNFKYELIQIEIPKFIVDEYLFDLHSLCYVKLVDFCNDGIAEYMQKKKKHLSAAYLSWVPVVRFRDGYIFIAALQINKASTEQLYPSESIVNYPYDCWK
ncbi:hypothetical protein LVQ79_15280 [Buttiauxella sp. A2-C1_F]|uniref:hypothetical protein n=1 Tax=Buttiauxella sp. A2-C1_F TaxID=2904526 RepID=UPI001E2F1ADD|nr:hypothetical protein [Buttiauxella sp. A2-C1_F]MCE0846916.1 hypothetical protein [Buttiauxella sp. A2-C1_F]